MPVIESIIIIGAGAAGLMAGRRLSAAGHRVIILEAAAEPGGRIYGLPAQNGGFSVEAEAGAEFIHGNLPLTLRLAEEAEIPLEPVDAERFQLQQGKKPDTAHRNRRSKDWGRLIERMRTSGEDRPLADFLAECFPGDRYLELRHSAARMAEGYDLADPLRVSTHSLYREWSVESDGEEYRLAGGYKGIVGYLTGVCRRQGCTLHFSTVVTGVRWKKGRVEVSTALGPVFTAGKLICTVSLGVLKTGAIRWSPELPLQQDAIARLGFGSVIKVLFEFNQSFWSRLKKTGRTLFITSDEPAPTWWTGTADDCPLITGWIAGAPMMNFKQAPPDERERICLESLAHLFSRDPKTLAEALVHSKIIDWADLVHIRGGYSFETVGGEADRAVLAAPVGDTLYFAGEAVYEGPVPGTVEAAFFSGNAAADRIGCQAY